MGILADNTKLVEFEHGALKAAAIYFGVFPKNDHRKVETDRAIAYVVPAHVNTLIHSAMFSLF